MKMTDTLLVLATTMLAQPLAHAAGAHEHGVASLNVARSGSELLIELDSPLDNFVGFEHAPGNAEQKRRLADALAVLQDPARVVSLPDAAACRLVEAEVDDPFAPHDDHHHEEADGHEDGERGHADLEASWHFECANAAALIGFDVELFKHFPRLGKLRAQLVGDAGQSAWVLQPTSVRLEFAVRP